MSQQNEYAGSLGQGHTTTKEEHEQQMQEAKESLDKGLRAIHELDKERSKIVEMRNVEAIVNGKYAPKCIVSTNLETEFIAISFQDLKFSSTQILMTKKSFDEFIDKLLLFQNAASYGAPVTVTTKERQLLFDSKK